MAKSKLVVIQAKVQGTKREILEWNKKQWKAEKLSEREMHLKQLELLKRLQNQGVK